MKPSSALACLVLLVGACKPDPVPTEQVQPKAEPETAKVEWSAPITMNAVDGTLLGVPMMEVGVRDKVTRLVVDTASKYNTLTRDFASSVRAPMSQTKKVARVKGELDEAVTVEGVVPVQFGHNEWRLQNVVAIDTPDRTTAWGIGGLVAPLQLVRFDNSVVMDFRGNTVYLVSGSQEQFRDWFDAKFGAPMKIEAKTDEDGLIYVETAVSADDKTPVVAILDSGSAHSRFTQDLLAVKPSTDECVEGLDPFAGCVPGRVVSKVPIRLGEQWFDATDVAAMTLEFGHPRMGAQGALGMDVLQRCTFAFTASTDTILAVCDK